MQSLVLEQQHMIETLKAQLHLALHRQFGRRNEFVDVDQIGLFAGELDQSTVIELSVATAEEAAETKADRAIVAPGAAPAERKKAVRILKDFAREIKVINIPKADKICSCCGDDLHHFGDESSEHLGYFPATVKIIETRRKKYACDAACYGEVKRAALPSYWVSMWIADIVRSAKKLRSQSLLEELHALCSVLEDAGSHGGRVRGLSVG
jgi:transposase